MGLQRETFGRSEANLAETKMIDIKLIRAEPEKFAEAALHKNIPADIPALLQVDGKLVEATRQLQDGRTAQNQAGKKIAKLTGDEKRAAIDEMATSIRAVSDNAEKSAKVATDALEHAKAGTAVVGKTVDGMNGSPHSLNW